MPEACGICGRLAEVRAGRDASVIAEFPESFAVLADTQGCRGWCVLLLKEHAEHLAELPVARQQAVFGEVALVARAIRGVFPASGRGGGPPRINYGCLGNQAPHIHWHVVPRHADDPDPLNPVWHWPAERQRGEMSVTERAELVRRLQLQLRP